MTGILSLTHQCHQQR